MDEKDSPATLLDVAIDAISKLLRTGAPPPALPECLATHPRFAQLIADLAGLYQFTLATAKGDLTPPLKQKGALAGGLKALQASLRHLTWQTQQVARGDFTQRVDFMGEFSQAFNEMVSALSEARARLEQREAHLIEANTALRREIADRERAEAALRDSEARYRYMMEHAALPVMIAALDDGAILYINQRAAELFQSPPAPNGLHAPDYYVAPDDHTRLVARLREQNRITDYEIALKTATGAQFWALVSANLIAFEGRPAIFASISNITERKKLEEETQRRAEQIAGLLEQVQRAKEAAEAASYAKSTFLANMSHELRTPLNAILGFSQLMVRDAALSPEQRNHLTIINRSGEHLLQLLNDILDMAKIEAGRITLQQDTLDLHRLLDDLDNMFRLRAAGKQLALSLERAPGVPRYVCTDESKLRQILINLLGNAVKFTHAGNVTLRVSTRPVTLSFQVQDTGPGITPAELQALFQPFTQSTSGQKAQEGTGLGLAISKQFARLMGGDLTGYSLGQGHGTLFTLELPLKPVQPQARVVAPAERPRASYLAPGQPAYRLLVAEDREESRQLLVTLLMQLRFDVRAAHNGQEAIQVWQAWQPHLIWMDMRMPEMDGYEATRRIKATEAGRATIIIAITASAFEEHRNQALAEGCADFVRKPYRESEIVEKLEQHLGAQFVYEDQPPAPADEQSPSGLETDDIDTIAALRQLEPEWRSELHQAAITGDILHIQAMAESIRNNHACLAAQLAAWADNFEYDKIIALTQSS